MIDMKKYKVIWADGSEDVYLLGQTHVDNLRATPAVKEVIEWDNK